MGKLGKNARKFANKNLQSAHKRQRKVKALVKKRFSKRGSGGADDEVADPKIHMKRLCTTGSLNETLVKGEIVLCDARVNGDGPFAAGAAGAMLYDGGVTDIAFSVPLPASYLSAASLNTIYNYSDTVPRPTATVFKTGTSKDTKAQYTVSFSSRGPNPVTLDILKPDISAPGVNILAAWPTIAPLTESQGDKRRVTYNIISGTSMACPHATAVAAYIKSYHPKWSPAAFKSAIMTTANPMSPISSTQAEFAYGAGHINPIKAINPGLVYDAEPADYVKFLCTQNYTIEMLDILTGDNSTCLPGTKGTSHDLNYPSFALATTTPEAITPATYIRTVTNVGIPLSYYRAILKAPKGIKIKVTPDVLTFKSVGEKQSYTLTISGGFNTKVASASLKWDDGVHQVRSPIGLVHVSSG